MKNYKDFTELRKKLGIDEWLELVKEHHCCKNGAISFKQYTHLLQEEIKLLENKEQNLIKYLENRIKEIKNMNIKDFDESLGAKYVISIYQEILEKIKEK